MSNKIILWSLAMLSMTSMTWADKVDKEELREKIKDLKVEIANVDRKINIADSMTQVETERFQILVKRMDAEIETKKKDIAELQNKMQDLEAQARREVYRQNNADAGIAAIDAQRKQLKEKLSESCRQLEQVIQEGLPWDLDKRRERVVSLRRDLDAESASLEEGFGRLKAIVGEEKRFGDEIAYQERPYNRNDGTLVNAKMLRIGGMYLVYVDDQEKSYGILRKTKEGYKMYEELNFDEREKVREAIAVKTSKKPPQLVSLPLSFSVMGGK